MIDYILENWDQILGIIGGLYACAKIIATFTPTRKDDEALARMEEPLKALLERAPQLLELIADDDCESCDSEGCADCA